MRAVLFLALPRAGVVPWPITGTSVRERVGATRLAEDCLNQVVGVVVGVGVVEALRETVNEDTRVWLFHLNLGVRAIGMVKREEDRPTGPALIIVGGIRETTRSILAITLHQMIANNGVNGDSAQELTAGLGNTEKQDSHGHTDSAVDTILDRGENSYDNTNEEDDCIKGRDAPELIHSVGGRDQIADSVNDNTRKGSLGDIEEDGGQGVDGEQHNNGGDTAGQGSTNTRLRLDGGPGKGSGSRVRAQERTKKVGHTNTDQFLGRLDGIVVDTAE